MALRPLDIIPTKDCCGCEACANICPKNCIVMQPDEQGFMRPQLDKAECIDCDLCRKACPILGEKCIGITPKVIACKNRNNDIRSKSSSGGVFTALAENIINNGGVIYGAMLNAQIEVIHQRVDSIEELEAFGRSSFDS